MKSQRAEMSDFLFLSFILRSCNLAAPNWRWRSWADYFLSFKFLKFLSTQAHNENEDLCCFCRRETKKYIEKKEIGPIFDFFFNFFILQYGSLTLTRKTTSKMVARAFSMLLHIVLLEVKREIFDNPTYGYGATFI